MEDRIITADLMNATAAPASRISEAATALGLDNWRHKQDARRKQFTVEDCIRIVAVKRLQAAGLPLGKAANAVKQISFDVLKQTILDEEEGLERWLVVGNDGLVEVCDAAKVVEFARRRGVENLRLVNLTQAIRDVFEAQAERVAAEAEGAARSRVTDYNHGEGTGIFLTSNFRLAVFKNGKGLAYQLNPKLARDLAQHLLKVADQAEAPARPEDLN